MKTVVAITGAGWDPVTEVKTRELGFPIPERTPEMFWTLGGLAHTTTHKEMLHTVLSRQAAQFEQLGASLVFVGTGEPGCSPVVTENHDAEVFGAVIANHGQSPWTESQLTYIAGLGAIPILMPDPHAEGETCWSTLLRMTPAILDADWWDRIVISAGDYVFRTAFLGWLVDSAEWPSQFWFWAKHSIEFLDRAGFLRYIDFLETLPDQNQGRVWKRRMDTGFPQTVWGERKDVFDWMMADWMEVSNHSWEAILELTKEDPV